MSRVNLWAPIRSELEDSGLPWRIENGRKHFKLIVAGQRVACWSRGTGEKSNRQLKNRLAQVRRALQELKG